MSVFSDQSPRAEQQRALIDELYYSSDQFLADAWDAAIDQQPWHLTDLVAEWYLDTRACQTAKEDMYAGERAVTA